MGLSVPPRVNLGRDRSLEEYGSKFSFFILFTRFISQLLPTPHKRCDMMYLVTAACDPML